MMFIGGKFSSSMTLGFPSVLCRFLNWFREQKSTCELFEPSALQTCC